MDLTCNIIASDQKLLKRTSLGYQVSLDRRAMMRKPGAELVDFLLTSVVPAHLILQSVWLQLRDNAPTQNIDEKTTSLKLKLL